MKIRQMSFGHVSVLVLGLCVVQNGRADFLNPAIAGLVLNSTTPDIDLDLLTRFIGLSPETLRFHSTITNTNYVTSFSGTYAGRQLDVTYRGDLSGFPTGAIQWTSSGTYGAEAWTSNGSAQFSFPTTTSFHLVYISTLALGTNSAQTSLTMNGTTNELITYTGTTGTTTINGVPLAVDPQYVGIHAPSKPKKGDPDDNNAYRNGQLLLTSTTIVQDVNPGPPELPMTIVDSGIIQAVPESSTVELLGAGVAAVAAGMRKRSRSGGLQGLLDVPQRVRVQRGT